MHAAIGVGYPCNVHYQIFKIFTGKNATEVFRLNYTSKHSQDAMHYLIHDSFPVKRLYHKCDLIQLHKSDTITYFVKLAIAIAIAS